MFRILHSAAEYTLFIITNGTFSRIDYMLGHKTNGMTTDGITLL